MKKYIIFHVVAWVVFALACTANYYTGEICEFLGYEYSISIMIKSYFYYYFFAVGWWWLYTTIDSELHWMID